MVAEYSVHDLDFSLNLNILKRLTYKMSSNELLANLILLKVGELMEVIPTNKSMSHSVSFTHECQCSYL